MSEDIPDDIMQTAEKTLDLILCNDPRSCGGLLEVRKASILDIATALHTERKKWDGTSVFNRLMEK